MAKIEEINESDNVGEQFDEQFDYDDLIKNSKLNEKIENSDQDLQPGEIFISILYIIPFS